MDSVAGMLDTEIIVMQTNDSNIIYVIEEWMTNITSIMCGKKDNPFLSKGIWNWSA